jgi:hypothetical protein
MLDAPSDLDDDEEVEIGGGDERSKETSSQPTETP